MSCSGNCEDNAEGTDGLVDDLWGCSCDIFDDESEELKIFVPLGQLMLLSLGYKIIHCD